MYDDEKEFGDDDIAEEDELAARGMRVDGEEGEGEDSPDLDEEEGDDGM